MKDLPDIALLASATAIDCEQLRAAIHRTFDARRTHEVPAHLPDPPTAWDERYARLARDEELPWPSLAVLLSAVRSFLDPVLAGTARTGRWDAASEAWTG
jgi:hypothetical protein